jgi:hypothetical protein
VGWYESSLWDGGQAMDDSILKRSTGRPKCIEIETHQSLGCIKFIEIETRQLLGRMKFIEIDTNQSLGCIKLMQIESASYSDE